MALFPTKELANDIARWDKKKLSKEEVNDYISIIKNEKGRKRDNAIEVIMGSLAKLFMKTIYENSNKFSAFVPEATFDDIFNEMNLIILKKIDSYDPDKGALSTWVINMLKPLIYTPSKLMGDKFSYKGKHKLMNINDYDDENNSLSGIILKGFERDSAEDWEDKKRSKKIKNAINSLSKDERDMALKYFGFVDEEDNDFIDNYGKITAASVGRAMGWNKVTATNKLTKIFNNLKTNLSDNPYLKEREYKDFLRIITE